MIIDFGEGATCKHPSKDKRVPKIENMFRKYFRHTEKHGHTKHRKERGH